MCRALEGSRWDQVFGTVGGDFDGSENQNLLVEVLGLEGGGATLLSFSGTRLTTDLELVRTRGI